MRHALILENDAESNAKLTRMLNWLGYVTAPVKSPEEALNVAGAIKFDVIITSLAKTSCDRRALTGELKRLAPEAAVLLIAHDDVTLGHCPGISAVIRRPPSLDVLRKILEFGIDGSGLHLVHMPSTHERRRHVT